MVIFIPLYFSSVGGKKFDLGDIDAMKKSKTKRAAPSARRLPTRSVVKKARTCEAISIEDDYIDEVSPCSPIQAVPVSKNVPTSAVKESLIKISKVIVLHICLIYFIVINLFL